MTTNLDLQKLCNMLNEKGACSFLLRKVKVLKANRGFGAVGVKSVKGYIRVEVDGKFTNYEFEAGDFDVLDGESNEME